ncbi:MAG: hypothetical protein JNK72_15120 [Myxococcales bacterium]|nr:hypothetical protein [Myxococcales bacterium]
MQSRAFERSWVLVAAATLAVGCGGESVVGGPADAGRVDVLFDVPTQDLSPILDAPDAQVDAAVDAPSPDIAPTDVGPARCVSAADCVGNAGGPSCDTASGACVPCTPSDDRCPAGQYCTGTNACSAGCRNDEACASGGDAGQLSAGRCDPSSHQCVACVTDAHCAPGTLCVGNLCVAGCNPERPCGAGLTCCDGACVDTQSNVASCGACGTRCALDNGVAACRNGTCAVAMCTAPFGDCDAMLSNGCETNTLTSIAHCGGCGRGCAARPNTAASCAAGACQYSCAPGFADCDNDPTNGCEVDTQSNNSHCGACGRVCDPPNGVAACAMGQCTVARCAANFGDCDSNATNGCETDTRTSVSNCGACGRGCAAGANAVAVCSNASCAVTCVAGFSDCDGNAANGCEVDTRISATHCGACGRACAAPNGVAACVAGACAVASCTGRFADCNLGASDGCEIDTLSNNAHCGACGRACGTSERCVTGVCTALSSCQALLAMNPSLPSGRYRLDLDGDGPGAARDYYCDMRDGGWTMVANQAANAPLPDTADTVNFSGFGDLAQSWRLGGAEITQLRPSRAWRLTDASNTVYFRPTCVVDWSVNYTDINEPRACTTGYTTAAFESIVNGRWVYCSARGIGINNSGQPCSMRMHEGGPASQGAMPHGRAATCAYRIDERVSLWLQ